jgi:hypothetical protein
MNYKIFFILLLSLSIKSGYSQIPCVVIAGGQQIFVLEPDKTVSWFFGGYEGVYDVWPMLAGNFLFSHRYGVCEVNKDKKIAWEYSVERNPLNEINPCQPLDNGNILILDSRNTILCNADWHVKDMEAQEFHLLEITRVYNIVWAVKYNDLEGLTEPWSEKKTGMKEFRVTQVKLAEN